VNIFIYKLKEKEDSRGYEGEATSLPVYLKVTSSSVPEGDCDVVEWLYVCCPCCTETCSTFLCPGTGCYVYRLCLPDC
jgi:hypothetical protein